MDGKEEGSTRIWCSNINGLSYDNMGGKLTDIIAIAKETQADILSVSEHNTDTTKHSIRSNLYHCCKSQLQTPQLVCSSTPTPSATTYKPGGTLMFSNGAITARLVGSDVDYLGRWSTQTFAGKQGIQETVVTCYQIPKHNPHKGTFTNYAQQEAYLCQLKKPTVDIQNLFYEDLGNLLQSL